MKSCLFAVTLLVLVNGCGSPQSEADNPLKDADFMTLKGGAEAFDEYVAQWKERVESGAWNKAIADGSYVDLMPEGSTIKPEDYPAIRIKELQEAAAQAREEIERRARKN